MQHNGKVLLLKPRQVTVKIYKRRAPEQTVSHTRHKGKDSAKSVNTDSHLSHEKIDNASGKFVKASKVQKIRQRCAL